MSRTRRATLATLLLLQALPATAAGAQGGFGSTGGTTVSVEGSVVTITVTVDLALGGLGETEVPEGAQGEANGLAQEIANYWNQGFERLGSDCLQFKLEVVINALAQADAHLLILEGDRFSWVTVPGHHVFFWGVNNFGNAAPPETYDPYDADGIAPPGEDYGSPLEHEMWGWWSPRLETSRDFAHELGHLMGFGDDYGPGGEALPGRDGTLMDGGDLVDQNLVNRLGDLVRDSGQELPECWKGTAQISSYVTYPKDGGTCTDAWALEYTFAKDADGVVDGRGTAELASGPTCPFPMGPPVRHVDYRVRGEADADGFSIDFHLADVQRTGNEGFYAGMVSVWSEVPGCPDPVEFTVSGNVGTGDGTWQCQSGSPPATYGAHGAFEITCVTCEESAVG
jgi:hypothetical protein